MATLGGGDGGQAGGFLPGVGSYLVLPIADELPFAEDFSYAKNLRFGMAINGIFGGAVDYDKSWVGRTFITELEMQIKQSFPEIKRIFIEAQSRSGHENALKEA